MFVSLIQVLFSHIFDIAIMTKVCQQGTSTSQQRPVLGLDNIIVPHWCLMLVCVIFDNFFIERIHCICLRTCVLSYFTLTFYCCCDVSQGDSVRSTTRWEACADV